MKSSNDFQTFLKVSENFPWKKSLEDRDVYEHIKGGLLGFEGLEGPVQSPLCTR